MNLLVCLIDDDKVFQRLSKKMLETYPDDLAVIQFYNGVSALEFIKKNQANVEDLPDLIFLDLNMPEMSGWEFLDHFKKIDLEKEITVHIVSSSVSPEDVQKAKEYSLVGKYIVKPLNRMKLEDVLNEFLIK